MESSVAKVRQEAKKHGYIRRKNTDGEIQDICSECKKINNGQA